MTPPRAQRPARGLTVVVPAHDERELLPACLEALRVAAVHVAPPVRVVVVLDDCRDGTADVVPPTVRTVEVRHGVVGLARAAGFVGEPADPGWWYATTDADTCVPPSWCAEQLATALVADVFVGTVAVADWSQRPAGVREAWDRAYAVDPADPATDPATDLATDPSHPHVHGASLGLRASSYWRVGGFRAVREHEDVALVERCVAAGLVVRRTRRAPVTTAARRSSRTPGGFSGHLDRLEGELAS
ncbi:glycosyltransferase [Lapillicoccus jejuensis]|uniref:4,4'-diaponeurosporenoate glycosyltransferase n=1 Tax=Lapillicoccus jejuensis TaxID=402171 RepID=A0A542DY11_9MICO|nr:glycosyltransferase [Lapillicoccus jejuensis]TQJ07824.1 glycosyl transferase family 2 [Lapillicoccus jejuensis]